MTPKTMNTPWENSFDALADVNLGAPPMTREQMEISAPREVSDPLAFVTGGKAFFTLRSVKTGVRYTYRVTQNEKGGWFVSLLDGPDNWSNYKYIGFIGQSDRRFRVTAKSTLPATSTPVRAFTWTWERLSSGRSIEGVEVWHEGKCGRCGRKLTVPESIQTGFGPECATKLM